MTIPNYITIFRFLLVPLVVYAIYSGQMTLAFAGFLIAAVSDGVDGFIARRFNMRSELGTYLDPIADKLLLVTVFVVLGALGHLPLWLAPVQAVVATIISDADPYAKEVAGLLRRAGLRVETDLRNEKINYKVREHSLKKAPVMLVVGKREAEERKVSVRRLGSQDQTVVTLDEALAALKSEATPPDLVEM